MQSRSYNRKSSLWAAGLWLVVWACSGAPALAMDLPSGLPEDLSDLSAYNPCLGIMCGCPAPRSPWYGEVDGLLLKRDRVDPVPLQAANYPTNIVLSTDDINSPFRAGIRGIVGHSFQNRWQVDFTYFWMDTWDDSFSIRNDTPNGINLGNLFSPFTAFGNPPIPGYDWNDFVSIREISQLHNAELNFRYTCPMPYQCLTAKFILGVRYMAIDEQFDYFSESNISTFRTGAAGATVDISTRTTNTLVGPQLGGEFYFYAFPRCWIDLGIKGAVCNNHALQDTSGWPPTNRETEPTFADLAARSRDTTAFVGDLDLALVWQLTPRLITRIGYQAIWVNNIAMAARNFAPTVDILEHGPAQIDTVGRAVYHGPHIGLEFDW
jgi:hypothetical protein